MENLSPVTEEGLSFEKVDVQIIKLKKEGEYFVGKYNGTTDRPYFDVEKQEDTIIKQLNMSDINGKNMFAIFADSGLQNAMSTAGIVKGDIIKAVKLGQTDLGAGRKVNNWSLYKATTAQ